MISAPVYPDADKIDLGLEKGWFVSTQPLPEYDEWGQRRSPNGQRGRFARRQGRSLYGIGTIWPTEVPTATCNHISAQTSPLGEGKSAPKIRRGTSDTISCLLLFFERHPARPRPCNSLNLGAQDTETLLNLPHVNGNAQRAAEFETELRATCGCWFGVFVMSNFRDSKAALR